MTDAFEHEGVPADLAEAWSPAEPGADVGRLPASSDPGPELAALHAALDAEGPLDRAAVLSTRVRGLLGVSLLVGLVAVVLVATRRPDLEVYPRGRLVLDLLLVLGPLSVAMLLSLRPLSRRAVPSSYRLLAVIAGLLGVGLLVGLPMAHSLHPASMEGTGDAFAHRAGGCFGFGLAFAAVATVGMGLLSRNGAKRWLPGALGVWAAGLIGLVALYFHCPITHPEHLWAGHATVVLPVLVVLWAVRHRIDG
ncbi:MAG: hypothetical protein ACRBN8_37405 [Nannocystales bacterium]